MDILNIQHRNNMGSEEVSIVMATDENYAGYMAVSIMSMICNSSANHKYSIYVLANSISELTRKRIINQFVKFPNVSISFINLDDYIKEYTSLFITSRHLTLTTYLRFFASDILKELDKIIYIDVDTIILRDISDLFNIDIGDNLLGACIDTVIGLNNITYTDYTNNILKLCQDTYYFNAGVLIINAKKWRDNHYTEKCINSLKALKTPLFHDQSILNKVAEGDVCYLKLHWNFQVIIISPERETEKTIRIQNDIKGTSPKQSILHYVSSSKPWNIPEISFAEYWWYYARKTDFYELFISKLIDCKMRKELKEQANKNRRVKIFGLIPLKIKTKNNIRKYYLFNIPIVKELIKDK